MKFRKSVVTLAAIVVTAFLTAPIFAAEQRSASASCEDVGRYQIVQIQYNHFDYKENSQAVVVPSNDPIKIDTKTGRTWTFFSSLKNGELKEGWVEVSILQSDKN